MKLSDFGIARATADASLTQTGLVTGSPAYLAPEVASGQQATAASDVWSLGATLFHALAGRPPYDVGDNVLGALYRIVHEEPPRLENAGWLAPLLASSMTHDPGGALVDGRGLRVPARRCRRRRAGSAADRILACGPAASGGAERPHGGADSCAGLRLPRRLIPHPPVGARRSGGVLPWLVGAGVIALVVMIGLLLYYNNQDSPEPPAADPTGQTSKNTPRTTDPTDPTDPTEPRSQRGGDGGVRRAVRRDRRQRPRRGLRAAHAGVPGGQRWPRGLRRLLGHRDEPADPRRPGRSRTT